MSDEIWSRSIREEIIGALWCIAALLAWIGDLPWLALILFIKATIDIITSICYAFAEAIKDREKL